jgi:hypothetical protein
MGAVHSIMSAGRDPAVAAAHVRSTSDSDEIGYVQQSAASCYKRQGELSHCDARRQRGALQSIPRRTSQEYARKSALGLLTALPRASADHPAGRLSWLRALLARLLLSAPALLWSCCGIERWASIEALGRGDVTDEGTVSLYHEYGC